MAGGRVRHTADDDRGELFPWFVTVASLILALLVFFRSTVPALTERDALERAEEKLRRDLSDLRGRATLERRRRHSLARDPEALMLEYDRLRRLPPDLR